MKTILRTVTTIRQILADSNQFQLQEEEINFGLPIHEVTQVHDFNTRL